MAPYPEASPPGGMPMAPGLGVDESNGTLGYGYRFDIPKARGRFQPGLALSYKHTGTRDLGTGIGWTLDGPMKRSWELDPATGALGREWVDIGGTKVLMVAGPGGLKRNESGSFVLIGTANGNGYVDAAGNTYDFGSPTGMQVQTVTDVFGNATRYEYLAGYPDMLAAISYDEFVGAFGADYATRVELEYGALPAGVTLDVDVSTGTALRRNARLDRVVVKNHAGSSLGNWVSVTQFELEYATRGHRQLLTKVTRLAGQPIGGTGTFLEEPPTAFEYEAASDYSLGAGAGFDVQALAGSAEVEWVDLDGDGRADLTWSAGSNPTIQYWARNLTLPSGAGLQFAPTQVLPGNWGSTSRAWMDFDGDGVADRIELGGPQYPEGTLKVRFGQRSVDAGGTVSVAFGPATQVTSPTGGPNLYFGLTRTDADGRVIGKLVDVNGDGVLDWLQPWSEAGSPNGTGGWEVFHGLLSPSGWAFGPPVRYSLTDYDFTGGAPPLSGGRSTSNPPEYAPPPGTRPAQFTPTDIYATMDVNGDGIPDFVQAVAASTGADTSTRWRVRFLTRNGLQVETLGGRAFTSSATGFPLATERLIGDFLDNTIEWSECVPNTRSGCPLPPALVSGMDDGRLTGMPLDLDGDGLPDFLTRTAAGQLQVWWNQGDRFDAGTELALPAVAGATEDVYPSLSHGEDPKRCGSCNNILYDPQVPNGEPYSVPAYYPRKVNSSLTGQFVDLNGDGILDYVRTADPVARSTTSPGGVFFPGVGSSARLHAVTIPTGAKFTVGYTPTVSFDGGHAKASRTVVSDIAVEGPQLQANTSRYWYSTPVAGSSWTSDGGSASRGYKWTWVMDEVSQIVRMTTWAVESHVTSGSARGVVWGPATSSGSATQAPTFDTMRAHTTTYMVKSVQSSTCLDATDAANGASGAPYIAVPTSAAQTRSVGSVTMTSTANQSCGDVDDYGNPTKITVSPDGGASYQILATYDSTAACKSCPVETWTSPDGTKASALRHSKYFYSDGANSSYGLGTVGVGRLKFVSRNTNASTWEVATSTSYLTNGNPQVVQTGDFLESGGNVTGTHWMSRAFVYDSFGLRVTNETATDSAGTVTLLTDTEYETSTGLPRKVTGPYVSGSSAPRSVKTMAYDGLGRPVAVGRGISPIGATPTTVTEAISAIAYAPSTVSPQYVKTYGFGAPVTLTCSQGGDCAATIPEALADVKVSVAYVDGLGRSIQVRERMGGSGTAAGNPANVTQALSSSAYRVSGSVLIDGAGRTTGELEPFYSSGPDLEGFAAIAGGNRRGSYTTRDVRGRVSCTLSGVYAAVVANAAACTQSDADDANHRTSVRFSYGSGDIIGGVQTMAVTATAGNAVRGTVTSYDAGARAHRVVDPMLSKVVTTYNLLGQPVTVTRQGPNGEMPQTVKTTYDLVGRVTEIADPNWLATGQPVSAVTDAYGRGRRTLEYFSHGGVKKLTLPAVDAGGTPLRPYVTTTYGSLLRKTAVVTSEPKYVSGLGWTFGSRTSTFTYDSPYGGDSATYPYVAGRMATASNEVSTIAFGYDQDGTPKERDQWFAPLGSTRYGASIATANDGRAVQAQFTSLGSPTIAYSLQYDSFGRPVGVVGANSGGTELWAMTTTAVDGAGAYDALGRIADSRGYVASNGGAVTTKRTYGAWSAQLLGQETKLGATPIYAVGSMGYLGEKLTQMTDTGTGTAYGWAYDTGGRLITATATASTSSGLTQNYSHSFAFSPVWNLSTANVAWNGTATTSQGYTYSGTDHATQGPGGYLPAYALTYEGMGNIVDRRVPGSPTAAETLTYTAEGYLRSIVRGTSTDEVLYYDALGNLTYRRSGSYLWFYAGEHATITATTTCTADPCAPTVGTVKVNVHVLLAGARVATVRTTPGQTTDQAFGNVLYLHRDRQGSVVATTTTGGVLGAQYRYGPYGELDRYSGSEATAGSDLGYTGGLRLTGGLIHLRARVYDPSYRRFLQADIVDPLRYSYTRGDPTNYVDPSGRQAAEVPHFDITKEIPGSNGPPESGDEVDGTCAPEVGPCFTAKDLEKQAIEAVNRLAGMSFNSSWIPVYGSLMKSFDHYRQGNYGRWIAYQALAVVEAGSWGSALLGVRSAVGAGTVVEAIAAPVATGASSAAQGALLRAQLAAEEVAGARLPQVISGYTRHGLNQAISREGVGVSSRAILDAFKNPLGIAGQSGGRFVLTGADATVIVNSEGQVISAWATGSAGLRVAP